MVCQCCLDESHSNINSPKFFVATDGSVEVPVLLFSTQCHSEGKVKVHQCITFDVFWGEGGGGMLYRQCYKAVQRRI